MFIRYVVTLNARLFPDRSQVQLMKNATEM